MKSNRKDLLIYGAEIKSSASARPNHELLRQKTSPCKQSLCIVGCVSQFVLFAL